MKKYYEYYGDNSLKLNTKYSDLMKNIMTIDDDNYDFGWEGISDFNWDNFFSTYISTKTPSTRNHNKETTQKTTNNQKNDDVNEISFLRKV